MRARRLVPLIAAAFLLVPALPASAHISSFTVTAGVNNETPHAGEVDWQQVVGQITCTAGERFLVTAKIVDDDYVGKGRTKGTCTGESQQWVVELTEESSGSPDGCTDAAYERIAAKAHTKINGVPHDEARDTVRNC